MVSIRPFEEGDNAQMLDIEKLCPQGNEKCAMGVDKKTDVIARYKMYDNWNVLVAEEEGKIAGWIGWIVKRNPIQKEQYVYLTEVMIHPEFRRKGVATKLVKEAEKNAREIGADHNYCYIYGLNYTSRSLFEMLGYSKMLDAKICALSVYKKANVPQKFTIDRIYKNEIREVVSLINNYYTGRTHFVPYTPESFESYVNRIPAYGLDNFWVVKDEGKIVACAGLWDCSVLADFCYTKEPLMWKVMRGLFGFLSPFVKTPKIPAEGEYFKLHFITDYAFELITPDAMLKLIGYFNNILFEANRDCFAAVLDPNDHLFEIIKKLKPQIETWNVFAKSFEGELPKFSPFYVDIRDMIL